MEDEFKAFVVREQNDGSVTRSIESKGITDLPEGDVPDSSEICWT